MFNSNQIVPSNFELERKAYYRADIDGLRGVAVTLVIIYHLLPNYVNNGFLGVDIFFVISGFVVTQALERSLNIGFISGFRDFYSRRIKRILPALCVNIVVVYALCCLFIPPTDLQSLFKTALSASLGVSNIALMYARFDYFSPDLNLNPFVHTWSLGVEEQFYFIFPWLILGSGYAVKLSEKFGLSKVVVYITLASLFYWMYLRVNAPVSAFYNPLARFWALLFGASLYFNREIIVKYIRGNWLQNGLNISGLTLLLIAILISKNTILIGKFVNILAVVGVGLIIIAGMNSSKINIFLSHTTFVTIGKLSYSLYLWHYPVISIMKWNYDMEHPLSIVIAMLITTIFSILSYKYIELRFRYAKINSARTITIGVSACIATLSMVIVLNALPDRNIYLGNVDHYKDLWPSESKPLTSSLNVPQRRCHLEYLDQLEPDLFSECSTKNEKRNFIYLIGNSHAQHLVPMLETVSHRIGYGYSALTISNCRLVNALQYINSISYKYELCQKYFRYSLDSISKRAKPGDIVLFGAKSLLEKPSQEIVNQPSNVYFQNRQLSYQEAYDKSLRDMLEFSKSMFQKNVNLIFTGPTPEFNLSATQCVPEWFRLNQKCKVRKQNSLDEKVRNLAVLKNLMSNYNNIYFWDPLPTLCDKEFCYPAKEDKLLFRDKHHLSVFGSKMLANGFINFYKKMDKIHLRYSDS